jgi:putative transposase
VNVLSNEYSTASLCDIMNISRSGYYKWLKTKDILNNYELNRKFLGNIIIEIHNKKKSYGYRRINAIIKREKGLIISDNLVHKVCKSLNIRSKVKHYSIYRKPGLESIKYPNLINNNWKTTRPLQKVVTDTTMIYFQNKRYDWTFYVDVFNDEIIGSDVKPFLHCSNPINHKLALKSMLESKIKRGYESQDTILHSDQGIIYSSIALSQVHKDYTITRSMSRIGTPTDNPIIESKNGWIKKEMYIDFNQNDYNDVEEYIDYIIYDHNNYRPSYALKYKTPVEYRTQLGFM